ncbi:MAG: leucine-rich repeat protein [Kiritimatiellia bacterium]
MKLSRLKFVALAVVGLAAPLLAKWTISGTTWGSMTDSETGWVIGVNAANKNAVVVRGTVSTVGSGTLIDMREVEGGTITGISGFSQKTTKLPIKEFICPDTVTSFAGYTFENSDDLEKITFGSALTNFGSYAFNQCTALKEMHFKSYPFSADVTVSTGLGLLPEYQIRVFYPATDTDWAAFIQSAAVTPWDELSDEVKANYTFTDGIVPVGLSTRPGLKNFWLIPEGGAAADSYTLVVAASGPECGEVTPAYGKEPVAYTAEQLPVSCAVTEASVKEEKVLRRCTGCTLFKFSNGAWQEVETHSETAYSFAPAEAGDYKLVWNWEIAGYRIPSLLAFDGSAIGCSVTATSASAPIESEYWPSNAVVTFTASGAAPFSHWFGNLAAADGTLNPLTVTMDAERDFAPVFRTVWQVAADGATMSDGYWELKVSGTDGYTIGSGPAHLMPPGFLDLSKPTSSGVPIVALGSSAFSACAALEAVRLPTSTLTSIGANAFNLCTNLTRVAPFLPDSVQSISPGAFNQCGKLTGDLVIGGSGKPVEIVAGGQWDYHFRGCPISSVTLGAGVSRLSTYSFWLCTSIRSMTFYGPLDGASNSFSGVPAYGKVRVSRACPEWVEFLADPDRLTKWADLTDAQRKLYTDAYPGDPLPAGLSASGNLFGVQWIFPFWGTKGMWLIIR